MIIGVLSDTHDNLANIQKAVDLFSMNGVEAIIHGGDFCSPFTLAVFKPLAEKGVKMHAVFGNNDGDRVLLTRRGEGFCSFSDGVCIVTLGGRRIIVMHYPDVAEDLFRLGDYDLVIHGHNHQARVEGVERKLLNPGTCSGYLAKKATVALVDTADLGVALVEIS
jgi:putative phosphoesterase